MRINVELVLEFQVAEADCFQRVHELVLVGDVLLHSLVRPLLAELGSVELVHGAVLYHLFYFIVHLIVQLGPRDYFVLVRLQPLFEIFWPQGLLAYGPFILHVKHVEQRLVELLFGVVRPDNDSKERQPTLVELSLLGVMS